MREKFTSWGDIKAEATAVDPRTDAEREAGRAAAAERREAHVRGHQLAEIRKASGLAQAQVAKTRSGQGRRVRIRRRR